jgi:hypothetical protein
MSRHLPIFNAHSINLWGTTRRTVGIMTYCMKDQYTHIGFKERCSRREMLHILTLWEEETSTLMVDSEDEKEEEAWVEVEVRSFVITAPSQEIWQGIVRALVPLVATATHLNTLLKIVQSC